MKELDVNTISRYPKTFGSQFFAYLALHRKDNQYEVRTKLFEALYKVMSSEFEDIERDRFYAEYFHMMTYECGHFGEPSCYSQDILFDLHIGKNLATGLLEQAESRGNKFKGLEELTVKVIEEYEARK